jgi:hypothetical protein
MLFQMAGFIISVVDLRAFYEMTVMRFGGFYNLEL